MTRVGELVRGTTAKRALFGILLGTTIMVNSCAQTDGDAVKVSSHCHVRLDYGNTFTAVAKITPTMAAAGDVTVQLTGSNLRLAETSGIDVDPSSQPHSADVVNLFVARQVGKLNITGTFGQNELPACSAAVISP